MYPALTLLIYCGLIAMASLAGGWLPSLVSLTHLRRQLMMSLVAGVMLSVALLHMLPMSIEYLQSATWVGGSLLAGLLVMFFLVRVFHTHPHDAPAGHEHAHGHDHAHTHEHAINQQYGWFGLFVGLALHSLLDGVALAASVAAEKGHATDVGWVLGLGTFLAVFLHKPLDALAITSLMTATGWPQRTRGIVNCLFAVACPLGAFVFWIGAAQTTAGQSEFIGCALAFSAGIFLCIALADLLPEVAFHSHDRGKLSAALLLGVAVAIGIELLHPHDHQADSHDEHDHAQQGP